MANGCRREAKRQPHQQMLPIFSRLPFKLQPHGRGYSSIPNMAVSVSFSLSLSLLCACVHVCVCAICMCVCVWVGGGWVAQVRGSTAFDLVTSTMIYQGNHRQILTQQVLRLTSRPKQGPLCWATQSYPASWLRKRRRKLGYPEKRGMSCVMCVEAP